MGNAKLLLFIDMHFHLENLIETTEKQLEFSKVKGYNINTEKPITFQCIIN